MTAYGLAKMEAAKRLGVWETGRRPVLDYEIPKDLSDAFAQNRKAQDFFQTLAPTYRKHFIGWISTAKLPETRAKRLKESITLLERGRKLGLK